MQYEKGQTSFLEACPLPVVPTIYGFLQNV
jgi:hypothetical protein